MGATGPAGLVSGSGEPHQTGSVTVRTELSLGELTREAGSRIVFAALAGAGGEPGIALVARPAQNWFSTGWELHLEAAPGILAGDPGDITLRGGLAQPFLHAHETYRTTLAWNPVDGELSFLLWNVTRETEVAAGFLYLEPDAALGLTHAAVGLAGAGASVGPSEPVRTNAGGAVNSGSGESAGAYLVRLPLHEEGIAPHRMELPLPLAPIPLTIRSFDLETGYTRFGDLLPLSAVRAGVVRVAGASTGTSGSATEASGSATDAAGSAADIPGSTADTVGHGADTGEVRFATRLAWGDEGFGVRIVRPFGTLPGVYRVYVSPAEAEPAWDDARREDETRLDGGAFFTLPAGPLATGASLPARALPPGEYTMRVVYEQPAAMGADEGTYKVEVRSMAFEVKAPEVEASLLFGWEESVTARLSLTTDQALDWLVATVRTPEGKTLLDRRLEELSAGVTTLDFDYPISGLGDLMAPLEVALQWPPGQTMTQRAFPLAVTLAASGDMEEITSYQQQVRRLVAPVSSPATINTYDLVELSLLSNFASGERQSPGDGIAGDALSVRAFFTSPSGEVFEAPGRRLVRPGAYATWVARALPDEPGTWSYRLTLAHPHLFPDGVDLHSGAFEVVDGGRAIVSARRPWGETESKPPGARVSAIRYRFGSTAKLEQLIGDWDSHLQIPTLNQTLSDYGVIGTDLGQPFEHDGQVIYLFGDTMGTRGFVESSLAASPTVDPEKGLALEFFTDPGGYVLRIRPPGLRMAGFEVPSGGMSIDGTMYFIVKDQMTELPQGMTFRSVLIRFDEERREFVPVREFSPLHGKFAEVVARTAPAGTRGLPFEGPAILFWGSGEYYRKGSLYLAVTRPEDIEHPGKTYYFAGLDEAGKPRWSATEAEAAPVLRHSQIGEFSVVYSEELDVWLLTYNSGSPRGITFHWAHEPWGPWSRAQVIFEPWRDSGYARFMHALNMPNANLAGPVINPAPPAVEQWGGEYAPYMVERFLRYRDGELVIYYLMSTWNPYVVVLMRTEFDVEFE